MDGFDVKILQTLQRDGAITNAALAEIVGLSASQCSRRRQALENDGVIQGYVARINARALGFDLRAVVRVHLQLHGKSTIEQFTSFLQGREEVRAAHSVSGDADYILYVVVRDLEAFADFVHEQLLPHPQVAKIQSEILLRSIKSDPDVFFR